MDSIHIRRAQPGDEASILDLLTGLAVFEKLPPPDEEGRKRLIEHAFSSHPPFEAWLAWVDDSPDAVGLSILTRHYSTFLAKPTLFLEDLFVRPEFRKRGVGKALLEHLVRLARELGCGRIEWTALDWNTKARQIYEQKLGAQVMHSWILYRMEEPEIETYFKSMDSE